jgi:hypothetical protein
MCFASGGGQQSTPSSPSLIQNPPTQVDPVVQAARSAAQKKNRAASGAKSTILSAGPIQAGQKAALGGMPLGAAAQNKTLLGQ